MGNKTITFFNTKGGTGKSTLSYLLYKHFKDNYFLTNTDFIKSIDDDNILHFTDLKDKQLQQQFLNNLQQKDAIIDTRGSLLDDNVIKFFIKKSNLIVVPAEAEFLNLRQTFTVLKTLKEFKKKILLVFNKYNKEQEQLIKSFLEQLKNKDIEITDFITVKNYNSYKKCIANNNLYLHSNNNFFNYIYKKPYDNLLELHNKIQQLIKD